MVNNKKKVLFIGNSFTYYNDLPKMLEVLADGQLFCDSVTKGGAYLRSYADSEHELGVKVLEKAKEFWDVVILQDQSFNPVKNQQEFFCSVGKLASLFPESEIYLYQTWAYEADSEKLEQTGMSQAEMTEALKLAYEKASEIIGAVCVPVGNAFAKALELSQDMKLYQPDHYHPLPNGSYIAACMLYQYLTGKNANDLDIVDGVTDEDGIILRAAVHEVIAG